MVLGALVGEALVISASWLTDPDLGGLLAGNLAIGALTAVGCLLVVRRPGNTVGWLCYTAGLMGSLAFFTGSYVDIGLDRASPLPGVMVAGWFSLWLGGAWVNLLLFVPLVFPDGHLVSRRWRAVMWAVGAHGVLRGMWFALNPTVAVMDSPMTHNPLGIDGTERIFGLLEPVVAVGFLATLMVMLFATAVRFRRATGVERLQLKWLLYASAQLVALLVVDAAAPGDFPQPFSDIIFGVSFSLIPAAIAVAVLRYRLYDIDRIISRTIVYAIVTVAVGAIFALGVMIAGGLLSGLGGRSEWAVAVSTLAAFWAFRPIRTSTQQAVDRRFNRPRYDAREMITAFNDSLREQVDIEALERDILRAARDAVQPSQAALWLAVGGRYSSDRRQVAGGFRAYRSSDPAPR